MTLSQPILGIVTTIVCVATSLAICASFSAAFFNSWVGFVAVAMIPVQIVLALVWGGDYPLFLSRLRQPAKGCVLLIMMAVAGLVVATISWLTIGHVIGPPTPMLAQFTILTVLMTMWVVSIFQCWPFSAVSAHPAVIGIGALVVTYGVSLILFVTLFNYEFMSDMPFYSKEFDPGGPLNAWTALTYFITTVAIIDALILLDSWPFFRLANRWPIMGKQPLYGVISGTFVLISAYIIWNFFVTYLGMDVVDYMVRVAVSFIFGEFIMMIMMQTSPFTNLAQPVKGMLLLLTSGILAIAMYWIYTLASAYLVGPLVAGPENYDLELWLATSMLAITFPMLVVFGEFFRFWPFGDSKL